MTAPDARREGHDDPPGTTFVLVLEGECAGRYGPFATRASAWTVADGLGPRTGSAEVQPIRHPSDLLYLVADDLDAEGVRIDLRRLGLVPPEPDGDAYAAWLRDRPAADFRGGVSL